MFISKLRFYSFGLVTADKKEGTNSTWVTPTEAVPFMDGDVTSKVTTFTAKGVNKDGKPYTVKLKGSTSVRAEWLPWNSNRYTAPDLKEGELVILMKFGDVDRYYWISTGMTDDLRRLESIMWGASAEPDPSKELIPYENIYTVEVDTKRKYIKINTTKANNEPFAYVIELDTEYGKFTVKDDDGNHIFLDSAKNIIQAKNKQLTEVTIDKKTIYSYAKDLMEFHCDGKVKGYVKEHTDLECDGPVVWRAPTMQFGEDDAVESSVLGDTHAAGHKLLEDTHNLHRHIGNLGIPTSPPIVPMSIPVLLPAGGSYSKVNTNQ